jgi:hypothetical protein
MAARRGRRKISAKQSECPEEIEIIEHAIARDILGHARGVLDLTEDDDIDIILNKDQGIEGNSTECGICYEEKTCFSPKGFRKLKCTHEACMKCWVEIYNNKPICPFCREDIVHWLKVKIIRAHDREKVKVINNIADLLENYSLHDCQEILDRTMKKITEFRNGKIKAEQQLKKQLNMRLSHTPNQLDISEYD